MKRTLELDTPPKKDLTIIEKSKYDLQDDCYLLPELFQLILEDLVGSDHFSLASCCKMFMVKLRISLSYNVLKERERDFFTGDLQYPEWEIAEENIRWTINNYYIKVLHIERTTIPIDSIVDSENRFIYITDFRFTPTAKNFRNGEVTKYMPNIRTLMISDNCDEHNVVDNMDLVNLSKVVNFSLISFGNKYRNIINPMLLISAYDEDSEYYKYERLVNLKIFGAMSILNASNMNYNITTLFLSAIKLDGNYDFPNLRTLHLQDVDMEHGNLKCINVETFIIETGIFGRLIFDFSHMKKLHTLILRDLFNPHNIKCLAKKIFIFGAIPSRSVISCIANVHCYIYYGGDSGIHKFTDNSGLI